MDTGLECDRIARRRVYRREGVVHIPIADVGAKGVMPGRGEVAERSHIPSFDVGFLSCIGVEGDEVEDVNNLDFIF